MSPSAPCSHRDRPLRLAVYGFVGASAGSLPAANSLMVEEMLGRGHTLDFFAIEGFIRPDVLPEHAGLRYFPIGNRAAQAAWRWLDRQAGAVRRLGYSAFGPVSSWMHYDYLGQAMRRQHRERPYDALLVMGLLSPWRLRNIPTVSWAQGTPIGEGFWFARHAADMVRYGGGGLLPPLAALYSFKSAEAARLLPRSDRVVCGSSWTVESWRQFGVSRKKLVALPYPIDLSRFSVAPSPAEKPADEVLFLHLGRIAPRKRFDLLVRGFALARQREPSARLLAVGGFSVAPGYQTLLEDRTLAEGIEHRQAVPRTEVPALLARADVIVQPSENEDFGSAVAEGLCAGRPVLVGPTNGTKDYISPGSVVFRDYTPEGVAEGMCEAIRRVRADRAAGGGALAREARATAERNFDVRRVTDRLLDTAAEAAAELHA